MNKKIFQEVISFDSDIYVGDYTEYAKTHAEYEKIGVKFSFKPFEDLESLHIVNKNKIKSSAVNFQTNQHLFVSKDGKPITQCEGLCFARQSKKHGWVLLIELKYCLSKNIGINVDNAIFQLKKTLDYLRNGINFIEIKDRVYWVVSVPDYSELEPFSSFTYTQSDLLKLREELKEVAFFRQNELEILTNSILRAN